MNNAKRIPSTLLAALLLLVGIGAFAAPLVVVDSLGRQVRLAQPALRIVSLSPAATETLFAIGAGKQIVGDTQYCNYPAEAKVLPKVGGFDSSTISIELIASVKPSLVVTGGKIHATVEVALNKLGIAFFAWDPQTFEAIAQDMRSLGSLVGTSTQADKTADAFITSVDKVRNLSKGLKPESRPAVFWEVYSDPLMTCGSASFPHAILEAAGARDLFSDLPGAWPRVSSEEVIRRAPAWIMGADDNGYALTAAAVAARPGWSTVPAVKDGRVALVPGDLVSRACPRMADGLLAVARILHPELFH